MLPSTAPELWGRDSPDGVEVASEVAGEARNRSKAVPFDVGDPVFDAVAERRTS